MNDGVNDNEEREGRTTWLVKEELHRQIITHTEMGKSKVNFESYFVLLVMLPTLTLLYFVYISYEQL